MATYTGTSGNDNLTGTFDSDDFDMSQGGNDTVKGGDGNDGFEFGNTFTSADHIDGGAGYDTVDVDGDYSAGVVFGAATLTNIEILYVHAGHSYSFTTNDANIAAKASLQVFGDALGSGDSLKFDASAEKDGSVDFDGGGGNDVFYGGAQADSVDLTMVSGSTAVNAAGNGNDIIHENGGNDQITIYGEYLTAADAIDGGSGTDQLRVSTRMTKNVVLGPHTITNVEHIIGDVNLTTNDATVSAGGKVTFDAGSQMIVNGAAETDGHFIFNGGSGNDVLTGGALSDVFDLIWGGNDTVNGGGGSDTIEFGTSSQFLNGAAFTSADRINGGAGIDTVVLNGEYNGTHALVLGPQTMLGVEKLILYGGHSSYATHYDITTNDATVAAGGSLLVDATHVSDYFSVASFVFDGSAETNGRFTILGSANRDTITTGAGNDTISGGGASDVIAPGAGNDTVNGGGGADTINLASYLTSADRIDGGAGTDTVLLAGNYGPGVTFSATTMVNVEALKLTAGFNYKFAANDATVAAGATLRVVASALGTSNHLVFDGSAETNGHFNFLSGKGGDVLTGGALSDTFTYASAADSTSTTYDTIHNIDFSLDRLDVGGSITVIDATAHHTLSTATFDANLAGAANGHLDAHGAMLVVGSKGTLENQTLLIIDQNGVAGYQAGEDLVIHLTGATHTLALSDFI